MAEELVEAGTPKLMVRALLGAVIQVRYAPAPAYGGPSRTEYWKEPIQNEAQIAEQWAARTKLAEVSRQVFDPVLFPPTTASFMGLKLPPEKAAELEKLQRDFSEKQSVLMMRAQGVMLAEDQEQLTALEKEHGARIRTLLTPEEHEQYELRQSQTAMRLRSEFAGMDVTEEEFIRAFRAMKPFDDEWGVGVIRGAQPENQAELMRRRQEASSEAQRRLRMALGESRYAEYERNRDYQFRSTKRLLARLDLPVEYAEKIYDQQKAASQAAQELARDRTLSAEARRAALGKLRDDTLAALSGWLGEKGLAAYRRSGLGGWLGQLDPNRASPPGNLQQAIRIN